MIFTGVIDQRILPMLSHYHKIKQQRNNVPLPLRYSRTRQGLAGGGTWNTV